MSKSSMPTGASVATTPTQPHDEQVHVVHDASVHHGDILSDAADIPTPREVRQERRSVARILRQQRRSRRKLERRQRRQQRATVFAHPTLSRVPTPASRTERPRAQHVDAQRVMNEEDFSMTPMPYNADLGPISRGIARFASHALTWLRGMDVTPYPPSAPLFGFIHHDVVQQIQEAPILGLTQLLPYRPHMAAAAQDLGEHPPLILIHGLAGSPGNFAPIRVWLSMHRPRPIHVFDYRAYADMFPAADAFGLWLDALFARYAEDVQFEILAHSMGGLITRLALLDAQRIDRIAQVLTLGTPHQGTNLARLGGSTYLRQLQVNSPVFETLSEREQAPLPYPLTSIWTERDILVLPSYHATMPGHPSYAMHQSTHLSWLLHPRMIDEVFNILDAQRLAMRTLRMHTEPAVHPHELTEKSA